MKPSLLLSLICLNAWAFTSGYGASLRIYVSPQGNDLWSGLLPAPNASRSDGPLATLEQARDTAQAAAGGDDVTIVVQEGVYPRTQALQLGPNDSGKPGRPIVWRAPETGKAVFTGAVAVDRLERLTDPQVLRRLSPSVRGKILVADLRAQHLTDFTGPAQRGSPGLELFYRGRRMPLARYPNEGWLRIAGVPQTGPHRFNEGLEREKRFAGIPAGRHYGRIVCDDDRPSHWAPDDSILAHGFWTWDWSDSFQPVQSIDKASREITFAEPHHAYGYTQGQRFYFLNVLEELDRPGEWYLDRKLGRLYFYPPGPVEAGDLTVSVLNEPFFRLDGASYIHLEGFSFTASRAGGVSIEGGTECSIRGCTFSQLGGLAVKIDGGLRHELRGCDLDNLATGAVLVRGGDRKTLAPSSHRVINNHIHHFGQWLLTGEYAVLIDGVGQYVAQNLIHDAPFEAIYLRGNDHMVELNEVYRVVQETGDAGALHTGRDWTWRGNIIRNNYWHHLQGPGLHGATAVYLDDFSSGFEVTGNIFYRAGRAIQIGGGRDNTVANNLLIECEPALHIDARGLGWASNYFDGSYPWLFDRYREMDGGAAPYADRYPPLKILLQDEPAVPKGNRVIENISWGGRWLDVYDFFAFDFSRAVAMRDNLVADRGLLRRRAKSDGQKDPYYLNIDAKEGYVLIANGTAEAEQALPGNRLRTVPPATFNPSTLALTFTDSGALGTFHFRPLPVSRIGLQVDDWRPVVPPHYTGK
ncbi:hypothetical protein DB347_02040 [Opitutaceae bacterium EW11]|nr:hypothetical protein DB347_02040 [Opitutaceae bacterium EW11]